MALVRHARVVGTCHRCIHIFFDFFPRSLPLLSLALDNVHHPIHCTSQPLRQPSDRPFGGRVHGDSTRQPRSEVRLQNEHGRGSAVAQRRLGRALAAGVRRRVRKCGDCSVLYIVFFTTLDRFKVLMDRLQCFQTLFNKYIFRCPPNPLVKIPNTCRSWPPGWSATNRFRWP